MATSRAHRRNGSHHSHSHSHGHGHNDKREGSLIGSEPYSCGTCGGTVEPCSQHQHTHQHQHESVEEAAVRARATACATLLALSCLYMAATWLTLCAWSAPVPWLTCTHPIGVAQGGVPATLQAAPPPALASPPPGVSQLPAQLTIDEEAVASAASRHAALPPSAGKAVSSPTGRRALVFSSVGVNHKAAIWASHPSDMTFDIMLVAYDDAVVGR